MAKSRGRKFAELISPTNGVFNAGSLPTIPASKLPTISISKLEDSTFSVNSESASLGGNVVIDSNDVTEHTNALYFTNARADARITAAALLPLAGGTMTGNLTLGDNVNAYFGASTDLRIYHDGTNSHIINSTGELRITGSNIAIKSDSNKLYLGAGDDLKIYHDGSNSYIEDAGTGSLILKGGTISINSAYTLPTSDGSANQVLQTDGSGTLSFATVSGGGVDGTTINPSAVQIGGTTVIDSSRNLSNIAQINANGSVYVNDDASGNNYLFLKKSTSGDGHLLFQDGTALKWQNVHNTSSGHLTWYSYADSNTVFQIKSAGGIKIGASGSDSSLESQYGQIVGGFGARATTGSADWNHSTNARSGNGYTLLTGSATNGPGGGNYFHPFSFEYAGYAGSGNMTQFAIGYNTNEMYSRYRYSNSWSAWSKFFTSDDDRLVVDRDIKSAGQVRATGWWNDAASTDYNGMALEIGASGNTGLVLAYNRDTASYGPMVFEANSFDFNNQVQAAKLRTDFNGSQVAPRFDTSFYVTQSNYWYGHADNDTMYLGEGNNTVNLRGQLAVGGTGVSSGYRLDLHGHTHAHNNEINYLSQLHFNAGARFLDDSGGNYTTHKAGVNTSGGFKMQNSSGSNQGYFYWDTSGIGILSSDGGWAIQNTNSATTVHHPATFNSTVTVSSTLTGSARLNGDRIGVISGSSTNGYGISLYNGAIDGEPTYGIHFSGRGTFGGHGALGSSDWATYFTQNNQDGRGWIFRRVGGSNVASIDTAGNLELNGNANAYLYRGTSNVSGTGDASYHPSGIFSTGTNWLYGTMYLNGNSINFSGGSIASCNDIVCDQNYGRGVVGVYSATRYQHVWSMGASYRTNATGTSYGNMYGLTYTHTNIGTGTNQSISGLSHQLQGRQNGTLTWAMGTGIWTAHNITAYSDISVKTNLERIPDALSKVCQLNGYTYDRTDYEADPETGIMPEIRQAGVVAQEVEKVLPEVVSGEEGNKAVAYGNMVSLLIEAIKEQQGQIEDLKQEIQTLKGER